MEQLKEVVQLQQVAPSDTISDSFASYIAKEMEDMTAEEKEDFKFDVMSLIRNIKKSRISQNVFEIRLSQQQDHVTLAQVPPYMIHGRKYFDDDE